MRVVLRKKVKTITLVILIAAISSIVFYAGRAIYYVQKANLSRQIIEEDVLGSGEDLRYIAVGDSIASGIGASEVDKAYPSIIANELAEDYKVYYSNISEPGYQTGHVVERLGEIVAFEPDIVTISVGANDATHLNLPSVIAENYRTIAERLENETEAKIYITNVPNFTHALLLPRPYITLVELRGRDINAKLTELESDRVKIINAHDFGWDQIEDVELTFAEDRFHPNDLGHSLWAEAFLDLIEEDF